MSSLEIKGKVSEITPKQVITERYTIQTLVLQEDEDHNQYPSQIPITFANDKIDLLDKVKIGDEVEVFFNLEGRENKNRPGQWFLSAKAWRVNVILNEKKKAPPPPPPPATATAEDVDDDYPF